MSGRDDLRNAFATALQGRDVDGEFYLTQAEDVLAVLADPVRRLAILDAMGLDVDVAIYFDPPRYGIARPEVTLGGGKSSHPAVAKYESFALVVRPRGAAAKEADS